MNKTIGDSLFPLCTPRNTNSQQLLRAAMESSKLRIFQDWYRQMPEL